MDPEDRLDEDFMFYLSVSERNWNNLTNEKDKELGQEWLFKLTSLRESRGDKRDRNMYLSHLALAMADGELSGPFLKRPPEGNLPAPSDVFGPPQPRIQVPPEFKKVDKTEDLTTTHTSKDGRTYVATKSLGKDHGAYTYIGISLADEDPLWVGGDASSGHCFGFDRHFEKPQTLYSKPRPQPPSTIFSMEQEGGGGDSPDDTREFTDYVTGAKDVQMSGTHSKDFLPGVDQLDKPIRMPSKGHQAPDVSTAAQKDGGGGQRKTVLSQPSPPQSPRVSFDHPTVTSTPERRSHEEPSRHSALTSTPEKGRRSPEVRTEKEAAAPAPESPPTTAPWWEGLDVMFPLPKEGDTTTNAQLDISEFYTSMITNLNNSLSGKDALNDYNKDKADEIKLRYARADNRLKTLDVLKRTKEALVKKLMRVKDEEIRLGDGIKKLEFMLLSNTTDTDESVVEKSWREACKLHNTENLKLLEEVYNPTVRDRVASLMHSLKYRAVHDRSKHMKAQAAAAREDFKLQTERLQARIKVAQDLVNKVQSVLEEAALLKSTTRAEDPRHAEKKRLAEKLLADVQQLNILYSSEYDACQRLDREILSTASNIFSDPEFTNISMDNRRLKAGILVNRAHVKFK